MATVEELEDEEARLRRFRLAVDLATSTIRQTDVSFEEASRMVIAVRRLALQLFPGQESTFDLIYEPRLRRILAERFQCDAGHALRFGHTDPAPPMGRGDG
jgi:hypothetical protein